MSERSLFGLFDLPKAVPLKTGLRADVDASVQRCHEKLPVLGQRNPDAVFVIERNIDDLIPVSYHGLDPDQSVSPCVHLIVDNSTRVNLGSYQYPEDPPVDQTLTDEDGPPPVWWWTDPDWIERETALVNTLLMIKRRKAALGRTSGTRVPHRRPA